MKKLLTLLFFIVSTSVFADAAVNAVATTYHFSSQQDAQRFTLLTNETRCVTCQFENIADSKAPIAASLREKIYQLIMQQKSDDEIKMYLVKRYGEVILLKPRLHAGTALLWGFPAAALLVFTLILARFYFKRSA